MHEQSIQEGEGVSVDLVVVWREEYSANSHVLRTRGHARDRRFTTLLCKAHEDKRLGHLDRKGMWEGGRGEVWSNSWIEDLRGS